MNQSGILGAIGLYTLVAAGTLMIGGNTTLIVLSFYTLILSLIGTNWKTAEKTQELNPIWLLTVKGMAVLNLLLLGGIFISLLQVFPTGYFQMAKLKFPLIISVLILLGDINTNTNLRKALIFFVWFDLVRWMLVVLGTRIWKPNLPITKIKIETFKKKKMR